MACGQPVAVAIDGESCAEPVLGLFDHDQHLLIENRRVGQHGPILLEMVRQGLWRIAMLFAKSEQRPDNDAENQSIKKKIEVTRSSAALLSGAARW